MSTSTSTVTEPAKRELDTLADQDADSTNSEVRYMAYASRLRTALRAGTRYVAYVRIFLFYPYMHPSHRKYNDRRAI